MQKPRPVCPAPLRALGSPGRRVRVARMVARAHAPVPGRYTAPSAARAPRRGVPVPALRPRYLRIYHGIYVYDRQPTHERELYFRDYDHIRYGVGMPCVTSPARSAHTPATRSARARDHSLSECIPRHAMRMRGCAPGMRCRRHDTQAVRAGCGTFSIHVTYSGLYQHSMFPHRACHCA